MTSLLSAKKIGDDFWREYMSSKAWDKRHHGISDIKRDRLRCAISKSFDLREYVCLSFKTQSERRFEDIIFEIMPREYSGYEDPETNETPDLILGAPWLTENSVLMMDPAYTSHIVDDFEVLEPRRKLEDRNEFYFFNDKHYAGKWTNMASESAQYSK